MSKARSGFTLIEILVVIAIIGIILSILTVNFNEARKKSRDKARQSDLKSLQLAIEAYRAQNDGKYPTPGCGAQNSQWVGPGPQPSSQVSCEEYIVGLAPDYIKSLPKDPSREYTENTTGYLYQTDGNSYKIMAYGSVETELVTSVDGDFSRCAASCGSTSHCQPSLLQYHYALYSKGAECW